MLKDEFNRLMQLFAQGAEGQPVNLEEIFKQSLAFFEDLNVQLKEGSEEDKKEALKMMSEMYSQMMNQTKKICEKTGMSEEQLASFAENPSNFSPDQWASMQEARNKMQQAGLNLAKSVQSLDPASREGTGTPPSTQPKTEKEKKGGSGKKPKKSHWMRS